MRFRGVLLKPLDEQHDDQPPKIDPAGVRFNEDEDYIIWRDFNYNVPDDVLGKGKIHREEDGTLIVEGELLDSKIDWKDHAKPFPFSLAIGVAVQTGSYEDAIASVSILGSVGLTARHADPTQPFVEIVDEG